MFLEERHQLIVQQLERDGRVTVADLSQRFGVTEDCIRKDLKQLSAEGKCRRVYGGATKLETPAIRSVSSRIGVGEEQKRIIAEKALGLIEPHQTIFLDISTSNLLLAQLIASNAIPCTIVSSMIDALVAVAACPAVNAICPGGTMHSELRGFVGGLAVETLSRFRFELAFLGAFGLDAEGREATTYDMNDGLVKACAIEHAARSYLVGEVRKIGSFGSYRYASFDDFDALLCDDPNADDALLVREAGLEVM